MKVNLTQSDWEEIWNAVQSKKTSPAVGDEKKWKQQLDTILKKLGPDGERAFKHGTVGRHDDWWTVILLYPDYAADNFGQDTYTNSARGNIATAVDIVRSMAVRHVENPDIKHDDLHVINVFKGKHNGRVVDLMKALNRRKHEA